MMRSAPCGSATLSPLATAMPPAFLISATTCCGDLDVGALALGRAAEIVDHDLGALGGGQQRDLAPDAAPRAGDDDHLAFNALAGHALLMLDRFPSPLAGRG